MFKHAWVSLLGPVRSGWAVAFLLIVAVGFAAGTVASGEPGDLSDPAATTTTAAATTASTSTVEQSPVTVATEPATPTTATQPQSPDPPAPDTDPKTSTSTSPAPAVLTVPTVPATRSDSAKQDDFGGGDHGSLTGGPVTVSGTGEAGTGHLCVVPQPRQYGRGNGRHGGGGPPQTTMVTWEVQDGPFDVAATTQLPLDTPFVPKKTEAGQWLRCSVTVSHRGQGPPKVLRSAPIQITSAPSFSDPDADVSISGDGRIGVPVTCTAPAVGGFPQPTVDFVWMMLGPSQAYVPIGSGSAFTPTTAQAGEQIFCGVHMSSDLGETTVFSRIMLYVSGPATNVVLPTVDAAEGGQKGETLTCNEGDWNFQGEPDYSYGYSWQLNGTEVSGATAKTYAAQEEGSYACAVVVENRRGASEPATSAPVAVMFKTDDDLSSYYSTPPPPPATILPATANPRPKSSATTNTSTASAGPPPRTVQPPEEAHKDTSKPAKQPKEPDKQAVLGTTAESSGLRISPYGLVNADRSHLATSVPTPADLKLNGKKVATGSLLALLMVGLLGLPAAIFNETAERHHKLIAGWMDKPTALLGKLFAWLPLWGTTAGTLGASALITAGICAFLSPGFPTAPGSWQFLAGMLIGMSVVGLVFFATWHWYIKRFVPESVGHWELYPLFAVMSVLLVVISRLAHFVPGVILGTIAEYEPSHPLSRMHEGRRVALTFGSMLVLALACWLLWIPVSDQANVVGCSNIWLVLDAALSVGFVTGLETTVFGLLPLRFLDGHDLMVWNRWVWAGMWGTGVVWFSFVIADPAVGGYGRHTDSEIPMLIGLLAATTIIALGTWAIFYRRHRKAVTASDPAPLG